jgi:hypothetical protein
MKLISHLWLVLRLRMCGVITPLLHVFMMQWLVKHRIHLHGMVLG